MASKLFILIRKKGTKKYLGAIPVRKGMTKKSASAAAKKQIRKGLSYAVVTETELLKRVKKRIKK